jgi:hypothetical protein
LCVQQRVYSAVVAGRSAFPELARDLLSSFFRRSTMATWHGGHWRSTLPRSVAGTAGEGDRHDLLACGYSSGQLHRWARALDMQSDATLADLLAEGGPGGSDLRGARSCHLGSRPPNPGIPPRRDRRTELRCAAVSAARGGAFVYSFTVKDAVAAARAAGAKVRLLEARRSYARGARKRLEPVGPVWIAGHTGSLSLLRPERGVNVLSLVSENHVLGQPERPA